MNYGIAFRFYINKNNVSHVTKTTLVVGKGQEYFVNLFLEDDFGF